MLAYHKRVIAFSEECCLVAMGVECRGSHMLCKGSAVELYLQPSVYC